MTVPCGPGTGEEQRSPVCLGRETMQVRGGGSGTLGGLFLSSKVRVF